MDGRQRTAPQGDYGNAKRQRAELRLPQGWHGCPPCSPPIEQSRLIPAKVPLGQAWDGFFPDTPAAPLDEWDDNALLARWSPASALTYLARRGLQVGLVVNLTYSRRYYEPYEFSGAVPGETGPFVVQVPCRGHGQEPSPTEVNHAVWEVHKFLLGDWETGAGRCALIHCTHGFNRTGYVVTCALARLLGPAGFTVSRLVRRFASSRPPGIYKDLYLSQLFKYHHEPRPAECPTPAVPEWKGEDSDAEDSEPEDDHIEPQPPPRLHHDDVIGEPIHPQEEQWLQFQLVSAVWPETLNQQRRNNQDTPQLRFPGSQPVSLDNNNRGLLQQRHYWLTWKADGTRYMVMLTHMGAYVINRSFDIRRVQMRFPTPNKPSGPQLHVVGPPHVWTLLDGEMVVDEVPANAPAPGGGPPLPAQQRRFLIYDIMAVNGHSVMAAPFQDRFYLIEKHVVEPRTLEKKAIETKKTALKYDYVSEPFSVRTKQFWPLTSAAKVIHTFIPGLCHESDGLILQPSFDPYIPGTCPELLKFKFAEHNSVDFLLDVSAADKGGLNLDLSLAARGRLVLQPQLRNKIVFPAGENPMTYHHRIVECRWSMEQSCWEFMRERTDKNLPNAEHVFRSVVKSIEDNIQATDMVQYLERCVEQSDCYWYDREEKAVQAAVKARQRPPPFSHAHDDAAAQRKDAQRRLFLAVTEATGPLATSYLAMKQAQAQAQAQVQAMHYPPPHAPPYPHHPPPPSHYPAPPDAYPPYHPPPHMQHHAPPDAYQVPPHHYPPAPAHPPGPGPHAALPGPPARHDTQGYGHVPALPSMGGAKRRRENSYLPAEYPQPASGPPGDPYGSGPGDPYAQGAPQGPAPPIGGSPEVLNGRDSSDRWHSEGHGNGNEAQAQPEPSGATGGGDSDGQGGFDEEELPAISDESDDGAACGGGSDDDAADYNAGDEAFKDIDSGDE